MSELMTLRDFFRQYFLTFMGGVFAACFSLALAVALAFITYFRDVPIAQVGLKIMSAGALLILLTVHSNFMILRGRPSWVWVMVGIYVLCLLFVFPMVQYQPHKVLYGLALLFPFLGLLTLNSKVQREMRTKLVGLRRLRQSVKSTVGSGSRM
jgi:Ca2+/Na+ antiporter